jgi:uncharacterized protein YjbI with pentapeptide repeats
LKEEQDGKQAKFNGMELKRHGFQNAKLSKAEFIKCNLSGSDFKNADLTDVKFNDSNLEYCDFTNAKLTGVDLIGANLKYAIISQEQLDSAKNSLQAKQEQAQDAGNTMSEEQIKISCVEQKYNLKFDNGAFNYYSDFNVTHELVENGKLTIKFGHVMGNFDCSSLDLTSLQGVPSSVGGSFFCANNKLASLQGAPSSVYDSFLCYGNHKLFTEQDVLSICRAGKFIYV